MTNILEIPLAILSFIFYKINKFFIGILYTIFLFIKKNKAKQWRVLSAQTLETFLSLPVLMTKGPRWNTHAIIGTLGPFQVQETISLDLNILKKSAQSWIVVIYSFPSYETITNLDSNQIVSQEDWISITVKPGLYSIGLRYYHWSDSLELPTVKVDDKLLVDKSEVSPNVNDFYKNLINQKNWFYLALHYYIFTILKYRKWLGESFVKQEFLPVGAPDTEFVYGYLAKNQSLKIMIEPLIINDYDIYFTTYDRSSFPLYWCQITEETYLTKPIEKHGYYLFRLRQKPLKETKTLTIQSQIEDQEGVIQELRINILK
ncbi:hypothetical protein C7H19_00325 [Aphanothece hegewaldii CCALA 016]|uniref:Uncharacterized protein n=1 Tax=Aphanothece hegewaldii CCALA 016 TaxID=2107694 RepID=A0A2T1M354_9CHRO|nr:DUF6208 family protein [Aphanothece hegewaldii]PSF39271.1 hypothetical protein C7H19_00325 [Aphanothece hegewaldii CCALA 016]